MDVVQEALDDELGSRVRALGVRGTVFADRRRGAVAVDRGTGTEHHRLDAVGGHPLQETSRAGHVVLVVAQRLGNGFADGFEGGEVKDGIETVVGEGPVEADGVANVAYHDRNVSVRYTSDGLDSRAGSVREVVEDDHVVPGGEEFDGCVAADIAGAAGH